MSWPCDTTTTVGAHNPVEHEQRTQPVANVRVDGERQETTVGRTMTHVAALKLETIVEHEAMQERRATLVIERVAHGVDERRVGAVCAVEDARGVEELEDARLEASRVTQQRFGVVGVEAEASVELVQAGQVGDARHIVHVDGRRQRARVARQVGTNVHEADVGRGTSGVCRRVHDLDGVDDANVVLVFDSGEQGGKECALGARQLGQTNEL